MKENLYNTLNKAVPYSGINKAALTIADVIYPVGAIYIGVTETCSLQDLGLGTWTLVSSGKCIQGSDSSHIAGSSISAGLLNIMGSALGSYFGGGPVDGSGCIKNGTESAFKYGTNTSSSYKSSNVPSCRNQPIRLNFITEEGSHK